MKLRLRKMVLSAALLCLAATVAYGQGSFPLDIRLSSSNGVKLEFTATFENKGPANIQLHSVFFMMVYDPSQIIPDSNTISSLRFSSAGFTNLSDPFYSNQNPNDVDTLLYKEEHPSPGAGVTIPRNAPLELCTLTFINNHPPFANYWDSTRVLGNTHLEQLSGFVTVANGYAPFDAITTPADPWPVELLEFTALQTANAVQLHWKTASETSNRGFFIHRRFGESEYWENVAFIEGSGNHRSDLEYEFYDILSESGVYTYRLIQQDYDGTSSIVGDRIIEYAPVVASSSLHPCYPNPVGNTASTEIPFSMASATHARITVANAQGQTVARLKDDDFQAGMYTTSWSPQGLTPGMYFIVMETFGAIPKRFVRAVAVR